MARIFDGVSDSWRAALDLSATNKMTFCCWVKWTAFADDDKLLAEFTDVYNNVDGGFGIFPNSAFSAGYVGFAYHSQTLGNYAGIRFPRPSAGDWHHWGLVIDKTQTDPANIGPAYIDGVVQPADHILTSTGAENFANDYLNIMVRRTSYNNAAGSLQDLAVWSDVLTADEIGNLAANSAPGSIPTVSPLGIRPAALALYLPFQDAAIGMTISLAG